MSVLGQVLGLIKNILWHEYDAVIYQKGGVTYARDSAGFLIASAPMGVDDAPVFNAAIQGVHGSEAISTGAATILVRNGNYYLASTILIDKMNTRLIGAGGRKSCWYNHMNLQNYGAGIDTILVTNSNVKIENLRFRDAYNAIHVKPADSTGVNTVTIEGCGFDNTLNYGIYIDATTDHVYGPVTLHKNAFGSNPSTGNTCESFIRCESNADNLTDLYITDSLFEDGAKYRVHLISAGASMFELMKMSGNYMEAVHANSLSIVKIECSGSSQFYNYGSIQDNFMWAVNGKVFDVTSAGTASITKLDISHNQINGGTLDFACSAGNFIQNLKITDSWLMTGCHLNLTGYLRGVVLSRNFMIGNIVCNGIESLDFVENRHNAITISGTTQRLRVIGNRSLWDGSSLAITAAGAVERTIRDNDSFITQNKGTATVLNTTTYIDVAHGLSITPLAANISVTPTNNMGLAAKYWISDIGAANFRINTNVDPGAGTATFAWHIIA